MKTEKDLSNVAENIKLRENMWGTPEHFHIKSDSHFKTHLMMLIAIIFGCELNHKIASGRSPYTCDAITDFSVSFP